MTGLVYVVRRIITKFFFRPPLPQLKPADFDERNGPWRPRIGMAQLNNRASLGGAGHRMLGSVSGNFINTTPLSNVDF